VLRDLLAPSPGPGQQSGALDTSARFGQSYEYTAQRIIQVTLDRPDGHQKFELAGPVSPPIRVDVIDNFPPAVPQELAAVFVPEQHSIDLSWQPDTESDLAGYIVYRSVDNGEWTRISGPAPVNGPAYRDPTVEKGHHYRYAVSAIDQTGHESKRSTDIGESTSTD
jgi:fibronectin type 3 domain-containing protein